MNVQRKPFATQVQRTPRIIPYYPEGELVLEDPARPSGKPTFSWMTILIPPIAMMTISLFTAILSKSYIVLFSSIGMTLVTIMVSILNYSSSVKKHREQNKKYEKKYLDYLFQVRNELQDAANQQRQAVTHIHPDTTKCIEIVRNREKQLWERTGLESDFLSLRMGTGVKPIALLPRFTPRTRAIDDENNMEKIAVKICEEMYFVKDIPVSVPLYHINTLGLYGKRQDVRDFLNATIAQITTHQGYDEVKVVSIVRPEELTHWEWVKWLPHTWDKDRKRRYMASNMLEATDLALELLPEIKGRAENTNHYSGKQMKLPHYIFLIMAPEFWESAELMKYLQANNSELGATSIFVSERIDIALPQSCQVIFEIKDGQGMVRKDTISILDESTIQFHADRMDRDEAERFARLLAPLRLRESNDNNTIPQMVTFLDSFHVTRVEELDVHRRWSENQANRTLSVPLGVGKAEKTLWFDMHEKSYGPHGLVAGTTGSGKSELLQSLLLALAVNYHPHEIAFVLIDYKGGGMANAFMGIPHLVGTITNLGGNQINRALASIKSELLRRQRMFSDAGVTNIDEYIALYQKNQVNDPLPHLIIVVDEFAELKADQPEFMKELVSAARVGRSLGIHLILATQKPSGVVDDQIWSNSRFKLCLKVQTPSDSQEMLKRPEAAEIKEKGRGYLQVGNNEVFTLFQSSWSGAPYNTVSDSEEDKIPKINYVDMNGQRTPIIKVAKSKQETSVPIQLQSVVRHISSLSSEHGIREAFQLWLPPLPEKIYLNELLEEGTGWNGEGWTPAHDSLAAPIGMIDNPSQQSQYVLEIDFAKNGHLLIYGIPSSGKTNLLKTIVMSLALKYKPEEVNFYILDFGTRTLGIFHELPHIGDVLYPEDEEKMNRLLNWLLNELEDRKREFSKLGISNLMSYRSATGEQVAAIILILDNFTGFSEGYIDQVADINKLVREGGNYGIYFVSTGNAVNSFPYRISQNIKQNLVFQMADRSDYTSIVGRTEGLEPDNLPGRGLVKDQVSLEFHAALPVEGSTDEQIAENIRKVCASMKAKGNGHSAVTIDVIPDHLSLNELMNKADSKGEEQILYPIGLDWDTVLPVGLDLDGMDSLLISYHPSADYEMQFYTLLNSFSRSQSADQVEISIFDSVNNGSTALRDVEQVENYITTKEQFLELTGSIVEQLQIRKNEYRAACASSTEELDLREYMKTHYSRYVVCIPHLKSAIDLMEDDSLQHLERIVRFGLELGVFVIVGGELEDLNRYQLLTPIVSLLRDNKGGLIVGGKLNQHSIMTVGIEQQDAIEMNRLMQQGEGYLLLGNQLTHLKLVTQK